MASLDPPTATDLEQRAAQIADPSVGIETKHAVACELRDMLDSVREAELNKVLTTMLPTFTMLLQSGQPSFMKNTPEFQFRRVLMDMILRVPNSSEAVRSQIVPMYQCFLTLLRSDNEDMGYACCKAMVHFKSVPETHLQEFMEIFRETLGQMRDVVEKYLSDDSSQLDSNVSLPAIKSFRVLAEMGMVMVIASQIQRTQVTNAMSVNIPPAMEFLAIQSPAQQRAREDYEAMGNLWAGQASSLVNTTTYVEYLNAQVKMLSYLTYSMRMAPDQLEPHGDHLTLNALRILQDIPIHNLPLRRDLIVVFRHLMSTVHRRVLVDHLDKLCEERIILGGSVGSNDSIRATMYTALADLVHHTRNDLAPHQILRGLNVFSKVIHNPSLGTNVHTLSLKMMFNLIDCVLAKQSPEEATKTICALFESCIEKLESLVIVLSEASAQIERKKTGGPEVIDCVYIERHRPVDNAMYATDKPEDILIESRLTLRTLLHGFRSCIASVKKCSTNGSISALDGSLILRLFKNVIKAMTLFDPDPRATENPDLIEGICTVLAEVDTHVFQHVWRDNIDFFFECAQKKLVLLNVCQALFTREQCSPTLLAIVLGFLVQHLPKLGEEDDLSAATTIRLFKMAFGAVATHTQANEPILAHYISRLLLDCFPLAAKAPRPTNYFHLLRNLFRAIGAGGGRFEILYKEVLPLLPEMLESLNKQLLAMENPTRDIIVELCLTVPLRLTHLIPHWRYLMRPLTLALKSGPDLVAQGLRTLDLCIDNLNIEYITSTLDTVLPELVEALQRHLKPLPANHHQAHTAVRVLGKLGGRNRSLVTAEPRLKYTSHSEVATVSVSFIKGHVDKIELRPMVELSSKVLKTGSTSDKLSAFQFLDATVDVILQDGLRSQNVEEVFLLCLRALFDAVHVPEVAQPAKDLLIRLADSILDYEVQTIANSPGMRQPFPSPLETFLDSLPHGLTQSNPTQQEDSQNLVFNIINVFLGVFARRNLSEKDYSPVIQQIANRFSSMCLDDLWVRKTVGCDALKRFVEWEKVGVRWILDRVVDNTRSLLHILKDLPSELTRGIADIIILIKRVLEISATDEQEKMANHVASLSSVYFSELSSSNAAVRKTARECIDILVSKSGQSAYQLLLPHRDRMLNSIYTKPLRAFPFLIQIGMIEAVRYCMMSDPPLAELNDELLRLLHEALALADTEDDRLVTRPSRQANIELVHLRVSCIRILTAALPLTDFFSKQAQTRQRVTSVFFKSLYSTAEEVKDAAHGGLRLVLAHQTRLPKELLQTGLRPILMNLADPKRLSIQGLEGLARLLELLTSYFKVEVGAKLLTHFSSLTDPEKLVQTAGMPLVQQEAMKKLVCLANIFHLLPSAADQFLEEFVGIVVQVEALLNYSGPSPFSKPLASFLNRYPVRSADHFLPHLNYQRHFRTLRSILQAKLAPQLAQEFISRTNTIINHFLKGSEPTYIVPCLQLFADLSELFPTWLGDYPLVIEAVLELWRTGGHLGNQPPSLDETHRDLAIITILQNALTQDKRIDLLFDLTSALGCNPMLDSVRISQFLYKQVALSDDLFYRRNILFRFLTWFEDPSTTWMHKAHVIRYLITPILQVHAARTADRSGLLDQTFITRFHRITWHAIAERVGFLDTDDLFQVELLHLTTVMVQFYPSVLEDVKKDVIKCAWHYVQNSEDTVVKQTAYLLVARFFAAFSTPEKMVITAWQGLLRPPFSEGRPGIRQEALSTLVPILQKCEATDNGFPQWATVTRRLLADEGTTPLVAIYQLIVKHPDLFYPVRALFVPHMVNSLLRLGLQVASSSDTRFLTIDMLQVMFDWEQTTLTENSTKDPSAKSWVTPVGFRENMVSFLVRLCTTFDASNKTSATVIPRALSLLQQMVGANGWRDVTVGLRFFSKVLEGDLNDVSPQTIAHAKVVNVISSGQDDTWYRTNAVALGRLVRKGMVSDELELHDALHPIFDRLVRLFPLPKEEDEGEGGEMAEFHAWIYTAINDGLRSMTAIRGTLLILKSISQAVPERIEPFGQQIFKLFSRMVKDHLSTPPTTPAFESGVRLIVLALDVILRCPAFFQDPRRLVVSSIVFLSEKTKSNFICKYLLDLAKDWIFKKQDPMPPTRDKISVIQKMSNFETRSDAIVQQFLEFIFAIYTDPSLRRTEYTLKLEGSFMLGCRAKDSDLRSKFLDLYDVSIPRSLAGRLVFIFGVQNWEPLCERNWISIALHLLFGCIDGETSLLGDRKSISLPASSTKKLRTIIQPMQKLACLDTQTAHDTWVSVFPAAWACLSRREQADLTLHMITLLSKDHHLKHVDSRPNVVQTLLAGIHACTPPMVLPPHLVKYMAKTYGAWYTGIEILSSSLDNRDDDNSTRGYVFDSLADLYAELAEEDMFYGVWRRRCLHNETNISLSYEQNGMWTHAMSSYEAAQNKVKAGAIPFTDAEYCLWEDHWIMAAEKLQQWEPLYDLAKACGDYEQMLECAWRTKNWSEDREVLEEQITHCEVATPRMRVFEAFLALLKPNTDIKTTDFAKLQEESTQLALRKWAGLPENLSAAHIPLLQHFQQIIELHEAVPIFASLQSTNIQNLEKKSEELRLVLRAWRDRLPSNYDDIGIWSDLVSWRQNVFNAINKVYIPLINSANAQNPTAANSHTAGYRGYHETAWIINRFAHVARKHDLLDVCFSSLNKIYTLPNIEISEAFLKLREQARCHFQRASDLQAGLEVINNTNLQYFSDTQKAEFFVLKGMFHNRLGRGDEASLAFQQAIQMDLMQPKAWAELGKYYDKLYDDIPTDISHAVNAVNCYLHAAGLFKNGQCRPLLARILWLLSVDSDAKMISQTFHAYTGDRALWYWIPLIPHLCTSLSNREAEDAQYILAFIAKFYPQALFFPLRTIREEQHHQRILLNRGMLGGVQTSENPPDASQPGRKTAWDYLIDILQILKTGFPLLALTMETMVDQLQANFKPSPAEETYRHLNSFSAEAVFMLAMKASDTNYDNALPATLVASLSRLASTFQGQTKVEFEEDFLKPKLLLPEYITRLQRWQAKYERLLSTKPRTQPLRVLSEYLTEFQYSKVHDVEIPGQYTDSKKDNNSTFVRIHKFGDRFENLRFNAHSWKRIAIYGTDHTVTSFVVQFNPMKQMQREEKFAQLLRSFNGVLSHTRETRKRGLAFHLPTSVLCSTTLRLYQTDASYVLLSEIYNRHCTEMGFHSDEPVVVAATKIRQVMLDFKNTHGRMVGKSDFLTLWKSGFDEICQKMVPEDVLTRYMIRTMAGPSELWRIRKQFALQLACTSFMTYVFSIGQRYLRTFYISRATGHIAMTDIYPTYSARMGQFGNNDEVPFRLSPNLQHFITPILQEGILTSGIFAIAKNLTEPEFDLEQQLCLFVRDELAFWVAAQKKPPLNENVLRAQVQKIIQGVVKRAETMACKAERDQIAQGVPLTIPVVQTVTNLISSATNPLQLTKMGESYIPWF